MANTPTTPATRKKLWSWISTIFLLAIVLACVWYLIQYFTSGKPVSIATPAVLAPTVESPVEETEITPQQKTEHTVAKTHPRYLSIPSLGIVKSRIISIGLYKDVLDSPANINDTGWYRGSATPGSGGVVVMDGHNGGVRKDGVFVHLGTLQKGAEIIVERGDGQTLTYKVVENESMPLDQVNNGGMAKMFQTAEQGREGLSLITCDGAYDKQAKQFNRRVMMRAVLSS